MVLLFVYNNRRWIVVGANSLFFASFCLKSKHTSTFFYVCVVCWPSCFFSFVHYVLTTWKTTKKRKRFALSRNEAQSIFGIYNKTSFHLTDRHKCAAVVARNNFVTCWKVRCYFVFIQFTSLISAILSSGVCVCVWFKSWICRVFLVRLCCLFSPV